MHSCVRYQVLSGALPAGSTYGGRSHSCIRDRQTHPALTLRAQQTRNKLCPPHTTSRDREGVGAQNGVRSHSFIAGHSQDIGPSHVARFWADAHEHAGGESPERGPAVCLLLERIIPEFQFPVKTFLEHRSVSHRQEFGIMTAVFSMTTFCSGQI